MRNRTNGKSGFLWGAATSSHQVEGNNALNDWWEWESAGRFREQSGLACDHYRRFREDLEIARKLGHTAHRFSLEWSRLEPREGRWDEDAWNHYKEVLLTLREFSIEPIVTLNHFTLPLWFSKRGGWLDHSSGMYFQRFAKKAAETLGEQVTYWITLNEPMVYAGCAYFFGKWPPGITDFKKTLTVIEHLIRAHTLSYRSLHRTTDLCFSKRRVRVGLAQSVYHFEPYDNRSVVDRFATTLRSYFFNHLFMVSSLTGSIIFPGFGLVRLPAKKTLDFIGINYYTREYVKYAGLTQVNRLIGMINAHPKEGKQDVWRNSLGWEVYPEGLYKVIRSCSRYRLPILVTENGICTGEDEKRSRFIKEHLEYLFKAADEGAPIIGYLYWSLVDNFEWADGYSPRFGLVEINYETLERKIRPSALFFSQYMRELLDSR